MLKTFFIDSTLADYDSSEFSWLQSLLMEEGVFGDNAGTLGLQVTQNSPTGMSVLVSAGNALVELTKNGTTWKVVVMSNAQATVTVPANNSGSNRVDAVILRVDKDAEPNALKNNIATIELVQGTGTSALTDGAIDTAVGSDGWIRLADITVANAASSIVTGNIADKRAQVKTNDSFRPATKKLAFITLTADPTGADLVEGLLWYNSTDHILKYFDGTVVQMVITNMFSTSGTAISGSNKVVDNADTGTSGANKVLRLDSSGKLPALDASNLTNVTSTSMLGVSVSNNLRQSANTERSKLGDTTYTLVKSIKVNLPGAYRVKFDLKSSSGGSAVFARIYKNGVGYGTERTTSVASYTTFSEDLSFTSNDTIELWYKTQATGYSVYVQNFQLFYDKGVLPDNVVITD
jgi:hypothetical protein